MRNASEAYLVAAEKGGEVKVRLRLVNQAGVETWIENSQIVSNSVKFKNETSSDSSFDVGAAIISSLEFALYNYNDAWTDYDFTRCIIDGYVGYEVITDESLITMEDGSGNLETERGNVIEVESGGITQYIRMGQYYIVSHKAVGNIMKCEAYDALILMDRNVADLTFTSSITVFQAIQQLCNARGITLANSTIPHGDMTISTVPDDEMTERQMLSYLLQMIGCYARMNSEGNLYIGWYDLDSPIDIPVMFSTSLQTNLVVFTGVRIEGDNDLYYETSDAEGLYMVVSGNPFINADNIGSVAGIIWNTINGMSFSAGEFSCKSLPTYEVGDTFRFTDTKGRTRVVPATSVTYTPSLKETIRCGAAAEEVDDLRPTNISVSTNRARKAVDKKVSTVQAHFDSFSRMLGASFGLYQTEETLSDGSTVFYLHDQPTLAESKTVWKATANAFAVTNDYNAENPDASPWVAGVDKNGNMIAQVLTTIGINVEWINLDGTLRDSAGTNWWNLQTGEFHISALSGYTTNEQHATDMASVSQSIQDTIDHTDTEVAALRTDAETMASTAEQNAKTYTDGELSDMNTAWDRDFTDYQTTVNHQLSVMSDEFSSQIETATKTSQYRYFVTDSIVHGTSSGFRATRWDLISFTGDNICIDGTGLTSYTGDYLVYQFKAKAESNITIQYQFDTETAFSGDLATQYMFMLTYTRASDNSGRITGMRIGVADSVVSVTDLAGAAISVVDGKYTYTVTKPVSSDTVDEAIRFYFIPGYKIYINYVSVYATRDSYFDSLLSSIEQRADAIELKVEALEEGESMDYIESDWYAIETNTRWGFYTISGLTVNMISSTVYDGHNSVLIDGTNWTRWVGNTEPDINVRGYVHKIDLTQFGRYAFSINVVTDVDVAAQTDKLIACFYYHAKNIIPSLAETTPYVDYYSSLITFSGSTAGTATLYSGTFVIPATTKATYQGTTYEGDTELQDDGSTMGVAGVIFYPIPGAKMYIYGLSLLGSQSDYAKSVLSIADARIQAEVTRATNEELNLASRITQTENSIASEISQREADYSTLSSAITQTSQAIETKVSKGDIASTINQTAQSVRIAASKIDLTGAVTMSSFDSATSKQISLGTVQDTRDANNNPQWYMTNYPKMTVREFKACTAIGVSGAGTYCTLETYVPWGDSSGGYPTQVAYCNARTANEFPITYTRTGVSGTTWSAWKSAGNLVSGWAYGTNQTYINGAMLYTGTVVADKIAAGAITVGKIADGNITTAKLADGSVTTAKIPNSAITSVKIVDGAITAGKIAANAVTAAKIAANAITADKISANAVTAAKIATNAITADKIAANAITAAKLSADAITGKTITSRTGNNRVVMAANSSTIAGYNGNTIISVLNFANGTSGTISTILAGRYNICLKAPSMYVATTNNVTGSTTFTKTFTGSVHMPYHIRAFGSSKIVEDRFYFINTLNIYMADLRFINGLLVGVQASGKYNLSIIPGNGGDGNGGAMYWQSNETGGDAFSSVHSNSSATITTASIAV